MPHVRSSCRGRSLDLLRVELEYLYAQRSAVDDAIRALQGVRNASPIHAEFREQDSSLEFRPKPCNLSNCRSA